MNLYVQYGCGLSCPDGWLNFDVSPRLRIERLPGVGPLLAASGKTLFPKGVRYGDIVAGLRVPKSSAKGVYCSHTLEHLDRESIIKALRNTYDLLTPGGVFRLVVPDLVWRAREFVGRSEAGQSDAADRFMSDSYLGEKAPTRGAIARLRMAYGNSAHRWMYDYGLMAQLLEETGFVHIRRCTFGDAEDPMFVRVEEHGRFYDRGHEELAIEARRFLQSA